MPRAYADTYYNQHTNKCHEIRIVIAKQSQSRKYSDDREVENVNSIGEITIFSEII